MLTRQEEFFRLASCGPEVENTWLFRVQSPDEPTVELYRLKPSSPAQWRSLSAEAWRYDHVGNVITHCERTGEQAHLPLRSARPPDVGNLSAPAQLAVMKSWVNSMTAEAAYRRRIGCSTPMSLSERYRETYFQYDYNQPVWYAKNEASPDGSDPTTNRDLEPRYDWNDYRGNVTLVTSQGERTIT